MPDIIKGKGKIPTSGGGMYTDGGSRSTVQTPKKTVQDYQIGRIQGWRTTQSNGASGGAAQSPQKTQGSGVSAGAGSKGSFGSKLVSGIKDTASSVISGTASAVQDEIRRRVDQAAQGSSDGTLSHRPSYGQAAAGGSYYDESVTDNGSGGYAELEGPMGYEDYYDKVGGNTYEDEVKAAIKARVQQATDGYNRQKEQAKTSYEDASRKAYISSMMSRRNLDQQLAANGVYGGMADSQRIAMDADYQNERADLEQQYIETLADLDQAITDAQLAGDAEAAEQMASYKSSVQSQYASYLMQKDAQAASFAQWQREQAAQRAASRSGGSSYSGSGSYSSGGYGNGSLTPSQVAEMQRSLGVTPDGVWGSESSAAADGMTADDAWNAYQAAKREQSVSKILNSAGDKNTNNWQNTRAGRLLNEMVSR